jgi:hypothetical protein
LRGPAAIVRRRGRLQVYDLIIGNDVPYRLAGSGRFLLHARIRLHGSSYPDEPDPWLVQIMAYQYTLLDQDQREILTFHLHPEGLSHVTTPHVHLGPGAGQLRPELTRAHVPTGPVTLAAVVRLAIVEFSVGPLRSDWDATVRRAEQVLVPDAR